jgi:hypothetical protein
MANILDGLRNLDQTLRNLSLDIENSSVASLKRKLARVKHFQHQLHQILQMYHLHYPQQMYKETMNRIYLVGEIITELENLIQFREYPESHGGKVKRGGFDNTGYTWRWGGDPFHYAGRP